MTLLRPRTTGRVLRGSALGLGLLVAGGITAPAAFAMDDPTDTPDQEQSDVDAVESPVALDQNGSTGTAALAPALSGYFGTGKDFSVTVSPTGPVPADLDLSGAVFRATPTTAPPEAEAPDEDDLFRVDELTDDSSGATCTTDVQGTCTFDGPLTPLDLEDLFGAGTIRPVTSRGVDAPLSPGWYSLTQVSGSPGLSPAGGSATFGICGTATGSAPSCPDPFALHGTVADDSLFRTSLVTTVTDAATGAPVACAAYELTGPDYPHRAPVTAAAPSPSEVPAECLAPTTPTTAPTTAPTSAPSADTSEAGGSSSAGSSSAGSSSAGSSSAGSGDSSSAGDGGATAGQDAGAGEAGTDVPGAEDGSEPVLFAPAVARFAQDTATVSYGTRTSDRTGTLTFTGYFLPAEGYLLTPTSTPAGYAPDVTDAFGITTTAAQAAAREPAAVARALSAPLGAGSPAPDASGGVAGAQPTTTAAAGATTAPTDGASVAQAGAPALATTGSPVGTMALLGGGLVVLGGGALGAGTVLRRRARQHV